MKMVSERSAVIIGGAGALVGLYLSSRYSYLLFHSLAELFSIIIAAGIFMIALNARRFLDNTYLLFIGIAYFFVGGLDLLHTLAYKGMGVFHGNDANTPTQLWIAARYVESISLFIAPFFLGRKLKIPLVFSGYAAVAFLLVGSIFFWNIFPACFIEGSGLTTFKKISEYIVALMFAASIVLLLRKKQEFDKDVLRLLVLSIGITIASELAFTFYIHVYGLSNLVGHFLKIISFYLIYKAIVVKGMSRPYDLLFRNLQRSRDALQDAHDELEERVIQRSAQLQETLVQLQAQIDEHVKDQEIIKVRDERFRAFVQNSTEAIWCFELEQPIAIDAPENDQVDLLYRNAYLSEANDAYARMLGYERGDELRGLRLEEMMPLSMPQSVASMQQIVRDRYQCVDVETVELTRQGEERIYLNNIVGIIENGHVLRAWGTQREITQQRKMENELMKKEKDLQRLAGRLIMTQEQELRRLSRELHDDLTQRLAVLAIDAGKLEQQLQDSSDPTFQKLQDMKQQLIGVSEDVHSMSRQLHPSILDDLGLVRAFESECAAFSKREDIAIQCTPENIPDHIPNDVALCLYRVMQEGLRNVAKHAQVKEARISIKVDDSGILLSIQDGGKGFDTAKVRHEAGLGLGSMRERVRLIRGTLSIQSHPGKGTLVEMWAPLKRSLGNKQEHSKNHRLKSIIE
ncbi:MAG TPA: hypothetical protein DCO77_13725 [Nitrospiraceae bacterium]|nr:hypothetical protein [Nitrospiraceae bacterium]